MPAFLEKGAPPLMLKEGLAQKKQQRPLSLTTLFLSHPNFAFLLYFSGCGCGSGCGWWWVD